MTDEHAGVSLREFIEAILEENRKALVVAEQEREKAARALRGQLIVQIEQGDKALEAHIDTQIQSVRAALEAKEKLDTQRYDGQKEAVVVATAALNARLDLLNKFREQSLAEQRNFVRLETLEAVTDRMTKLEDESHRALSRETYDERHEALMNRVSELEKRGFGGVEGAKAIEALRVRLYTIAGLIIAAVSIGVAVVLAGNN